MGTPFPPVSIAARPYWNNTGIRLKAGTAYAFSASGEWYDASIKCGPDGWQSNDLKFKLFVPFRRAKGSTWFTLMGSLDRDPALVFPIGRGIPRKTFERDGELTCFANDASFMYFNNSGAVSLTVSTAD